MKRNTELCTAVGFCAVLCGFAAAFLLLPPRAFSAQENRYLAQLPEISAKSLFSGDWSRDTESYISDQFPLRDKLVAVQSAVCRLRGERDHNGVYYGEALAETFWDYPKETWQRNLKAVETLAQKSGVPVYFVPVPDACEMLRSDRPMLYPDISQEKLLTEAAEASPTAHLVNLRQPLLNAWHSGRQIYYRTDHHMTTAGAYLVYTGLAEAMQLSPLPESVFTKSAVTDRFTGTLYHKSGAVWTKPDTIERWDAPGLTASLTILPANERHSTIYDDRAPGSNDPYGYFAFGNQPLEIIRTNSGGGKLLLIKDSYAHAVLPFLCSHFSEIHMIDLRYDHRSIRSYIKDNGIDAAVVLYHMSNFAADTNAALMIL